MDLQDTSNRKKSQETFLNNEGRYSDVVENSNDGIVIHKEGKIVFVNRTVKKNLGYDVDEVIGRNIIDFIAPEFHEVIMERMKARHDGEKVPEIIQIVLIRKDSSRLPIEINASSINYEGEDAMLVFMRDITERKIVEEKLKESEEKFRILIENSADAIFIVNQKKEFVFVNKAVTNLYGYTLDELLSKTILDLTPPGRSQEYIEYFSEVIQANKLLIELDVVKKDGTYLPTELNAVLLPNGLVYASCRDNSKRKLAEEELQKKTNELETFNKAMIGREMRIIEMKEEVNKLSEQLGNAPPYPTIWNDNKQSDEGIL